MKSFKYIYTALLFVLVMGACKVSKDVAKPADATPEQFRNNVAATDTSSIARLPYKEFFKEELIRDLIDTALLHNYDMQIALKNMEAASLLFSQSKLGNLPAINLQVTANSSRPSDNSLNGLTISQFANAKHIEDYTASAGLSWEADIWRKIANQRNAAGAVYLQSAEARKAIQTRLVANVAQSYYRLIMLDTQLDIARKNLALNDSTLTIIKMQFDAGQVTSLAIQQAEAQQLVAAGLIPQLEQRINLEENALSILSGAFPAAIRRQGRLNTMVSQDQLGTGIPSAMVSLRPDVKSAELELMRANAKVGIAKASMYPALTITANGGLNSFKSSNWFNIPGSLFGVVAGGIAQPVFQRKQLRTQYEVALVDREKSVIQFRQSVLVAVGEVSDELIKIEKLKQQYVIAEQRVKVVQGGLQNANLLFKSGMANYLEVINAQSNALQSELDLATVKTAQLSAAVELYRTLGGGWK
ncbi:efflux transporter outer membrane subunit [Pedobacter sp. MR2016-24]|uniref:efflux transporter outer membrane subunit n=1 Tax=Pedobacter sp. MR2016-24 TaxID=2994466 RepID=UPI00224564F8|nr:efflux transporter outer membrane subunit [Pedobacter sp. MR2016-24]MCX2486567.1 efflux transporter outer membrane subunit [Pedobacter sp. MR2016-24]